MAQRAPTNFTTWTDQRRFISAEKIRSDEVEEYINDQVYVLNAPMLQVSDQFCAQRVTTASPAWIEVARYRLHARDICGADDAYTPDTPVSVGLLCWSDGTGTGNIRVTAQNAAGGAGSSTALTLAITDTGVIWRAATGIEVITDNAVEEILVEANLTSGAGAIFVAGVCIIATAI